MSWKSIDAEKAIPWVEARTGLALADSQKTAIHAALRSKAMVIAGGPGVGETTRVNSILRILAAKKVCLLLCAPTGRAAKRMTETTGHEAKTIADMIASGAMPVVRLTEVFRQAAQSQIVQSASTSGVERFGGAARRTASRGNGRRNWPTAGFP